MFSQLHQPFKSPTMPLINVYIFFLQQKHMATLLVLNVNGFGFFKRKIDFFGSFAISMQRRVIQAVASIEASLPW
ncbi:hypothetical protein AGMMS49921_13480 [Endomicrobiia bacterium]|nr:hypothetical protein AGMMS49921_13480 [Endomicrobiia bacterium]